MGWNELDVRSRAAGGMAPVRQAPTPVIETTPEGENPSGDPTTWGNRVTWQVTLPAGAVELRSYSGQIVRAQVADRRARNWRWVVQTSLSLLSGPGPELVDLGLEVTMGAGLSAITHRLSLVPSITNSIAIGGWVPEGTATSLTLIAQRIWNFTDWIGEAVAVRAYYVWSNPNPDASVLSLDTAIVMEPEER